MSYSLDPQRKCPYMVVDYSNEAGMEGVYAGSYDDCVIASNGCTGSNPR